MSKEVIGAVTQNKTPEYILYLIISTNLLLFICIVTEKFLSAHIYRFMVITDFRYFILIFKKAIESDYENMECAHGLTRISKALENISGDDRGVRQILQIIPSIIANIIGIIFYGIILLSLSPLILIAITLTTISGFFILKMTASWNYNNKNKWKAYDRKISYLRENSGDFSKAKDLRLYGMSDWFKQVFENTLSSRMRWHKKEQSFCFKLDFLRAVLSLFREGISYGVLIYLVYKNNLSVSDFVLYFGVISGFSGWLNGIVNDLDNLYRIHLGFSEMREFLDYPDKSNCSDGTPIPNETFCIEFKNVSYRYEGNTEDTIKNLSFRINKGEKIAIVGPNGAGKTTLVKLICGLYNPTEGEILINGIPVNSFNRQKYYSLFSAVFQEIFIMPMSVARNVSTLTEDETDKQKVIDALTLAGISPKINALSKGMDTKLIKSVYEDAVDFSGGEMQKLALARALYKNGKALILDEPTAALDPIAESSIYAEYNRMTLGRTSVFISHRLASTGFCHNIYFLEKGKIIECGNHKELMSRKGKYFEMFEIQSHYYKEEARA